MLQFFRPIVRRLPALLLLATLSGCGGGGGGGTDPTPVSTTTPTTSTGNTPPDNADPLTSCLPSGKGTDYQVGPGKAYTTLESVPWENLQAGDTVRIYYASTPYAGKFVIKAQGTADKWVRICGVRSSSGQRPMITGVNARSRAQLASLISNDPFYRDIHETRSIILIKNDVADYSSYPRYIQIDGLNITGAHPNYSFTDTAGVTKNYVAFGAAIWIDRGQHITIADNEISDSQMAIFSKSTDDGAFAVTKDIRISGNTMWGHGIVNDVHMHTTYTQSVGIVIEFNRYGALRSGALGNSAKDRSVGTVVRYNRIEDGAHAIDLVESEDFPLTATADPNYRSTYVYGNLITKNGDTGSVIHYGGDHYGSSVGLTWGEPIFRKGTLYFWNNTVVLSGTNAWMFQLATTEEKAEVWNNVFVYAPSITEKSLRMSTDLGGTTWTAGGIVNLGLNWATTGWQDTDQYHPVPGQLNGTTNLISAIAAPIDLASYAPLSGSSIVDATVAGPTAVASWPLSYQISADAVASTRSTHGSANDLGALEQ